MLFLVFLYYLLFLLHFFCLFFFSLIYFFILFFFTSLLGFNYLGFTIQNSLVNYKLIWEKIIIFIGEEGIHMSIPNDALFILLYLHYESCISFYQNSLIYFDLLLSLFSYYNPNPAKFLFI